jgi:inorganic triphosphatase YgiF
MLEEQADPVAAEAGADLATGPKPAQEVELKLLASADGLGRLREAPVILRYARNGGVARRLEATYFDTSDHRLHRHGLSLRVRRQGRSYVQTLKRSPVPGHPFVRGEWETPVDGMVPDLGLLPAAEITPLFDAAVAAPALDPIFTTNVRRRVQRLDLADALVEVAFDEGSIEAGERCEPLSEVELELKSGAPRALYDLGIELIGRTSLRIGTRSKAERGYDLALGLAPQAVKAKVPRLAPDCTVDDVIAVLLRTCQHQVLANQAVVEAGRDIEGVHQMRVALRRLRTAFSLLHRELELPTLGAVGEDAKWLSRLLGTARDWDVFATETLAVPSAALGADVDFAGVREAAEPHRLAAYAALREAIASERYNRFQLSLLRWIESRSWRNELASQPLAALLEPAPAFASRVLARLHHKALRRGRHFRHLQPGERHKVRIALKKLRYALEFFQDLPSVHGGAKHYVRCLSMLQDALGHANDAATTLPHLVAVAGGPAAPPGVERGIGAVMGWQARERIETGRTLRKYWSRFKATPVAWAS